MDERERRRCLRVLDSKEERKGKVILNVLGFITYMIQKETKQGKRYTFKANEAVEER